MPTICNSSPLILYDRIGRLELLHAVFGEVIVPTAVYREVVDRGRGRAGAATVPGAPWIQVRTVDNRQEVLSLLSKADPGEAKVLALAAESGEQVTVVIDDRKGRRLARQRGMEFIGSAGVLLVARSGDSFQRCARSSTS